MGLFNRKPKQFDLDHPVIHQLLVAATREMNYGAVEDLYVNASRALGGPPAWPWWIGLAERAEASGRLETARLAVDFAYTANVPPWGDLSNEDYDRLRPMRGRLGG